MAYRWQCLMSLAFAVAVFLAWIVLYLARGAFWRADQRLVVGEIAEWPAVTAVVPARNEAAGIAACVRGILAQDYPGTLYLIVIDDQSVDDTAELAQSAAAELGAASRLTVLRGKDLPAGWAGKVWAMQQGVEAAAGDTPYLWFTDGDIVHAPQVLRALVAKAVAEKRVLVSLMVRLSCQTLWERWLIPPFLFFFQKLYPFAWVNDSRRRLAGAAGGCMLVARAALETSGGLPAMRGALIDDCTLAAQLKAEGPIWLGLADHSISLRRYTHLQEIWRMVARSAYVQLEFRPSRLLIATLAMLFLYLLPWVLLVLGLMNGQPWVWGLSLASLLLSWRIFWPTLHDYRLSPMWALSLQPAAWLYTLMTLDSARRHYGGRGGAWKGRVYPAERGR
ncbi:glycosyltransferase [Acidithiobacillus sp. AMEEHan]|uniref:glycosyltransferase n=1 Tax=Acidithiobacillus sp. AMEEHan TaxID=2994951 RepID=UPI0027E41371|nr:glycosyltransferase [Acidithiobacillus sp. AMEEHan]